MAPLGSNDVIDLTDEIHVNCAEPTPNQATAEDSRPHQIEPYGKMLLETGAVPRHSYIDADVVAFSKLNPTWKVQTDIDDGSRLVIGTGGIRYTLVS